MGIFNLKKEKILTSAILAVSLTGIFYFGYRAVRGHGKNDQQNPFAYDIQSYAESGADLVHYSEVGHIPIDLPKVSGIAVGPDDRIYVSGNGSVLVFDNDGTPRSSFKSSGPIRCLAIDKNHDLYLGMGDHVEVYDQKGIRQAGWESLGEKAIITSIAVSAKSVFVADAGNKIVWKFDKSGLNLQRIGDKNETKDIPGFIIPSPYFDVAIDADGFLWVANTGRHSLENYTVDGNFRTSWGEFGMEIQGFSGCCNPSHFTLLVDGSFVTSEKGLPRIKIYNRLGNLVSVVAPTEQFLEGTVGLDLAVDSTQKIYVLDPLQKRVRIFAKKKS
ncbi:MAG: NHL repeat-containing protein [Candidatus Aminicenantes bacterium]|nr:MAG: NHL repeat-containing protein [Candidatus Aminicenantes bacterium]